MQGRLKITTETKPLRHPKRYGLALAISAALVAAYAGWVWLFGGAEVVAEAIGSRRGTWYSAALALEGTLLGFVFTAATMSMSSVSSPRVRRLLAGGTGQQLWNVYIDTIKMLGAATGLTSIALALDPDLQSEPVTYSVTGHIMLGLTLCAAAVSSVGVYWSVKLLRVVLNLMVSDLDRED